MGTAVGMVVAMGALVGAAAGSSVGTAAGAEGPGADAVGATATQPVAVKTRASNTIAAFIARGGERKNVSPISHSPQVTQISSTRKSSAGWRSTPVGGYEQGNPDDHGCEAEKGVLDVPTHQPALQDVDAL
jgi:hypothetical protein